MLEPHIYGRVEHMQAKCIDETLSLYLVHRGRLNRIYDVHDAHAKLNLICDVATEAELREWHPSRYELGGYRTCLTDGLFRLAAPPHGVVTCSVDSAASVLEDLARQKYTSNDVFSQVSRIVEKIRQEFEEHAQQQIETIKEQASRLDMRRQIDTSLAGISEGIAKLIEIAKANHQQNARNEVALRNLAQVMRNRNWK